MLYKCYLRNSIVYVPSIGKRGGAYVVIEPVAAVPVSNTDDLHHAFAETIARGNAALPLLKGKRSPPLMLKYTGVGSWPAFVRSTLNWNIQEIGGRYQIVGHLSRPNGSWVEDLDHKIVFPSGTTLDAVVDRMIEILQDAARGTE